MCILEQTKNVSKSEESGESQRVLERKEVKRKVDLHVGDGHGVLKKLYVEKAECIGTRLKFNNQTPGDIHIRYTKVKHSLFSERQSSINCFSVGDCLSYSSSGTEREGYNPLNDGYKVTAVSVNPNSYLDLIDLNNDAKFEYPLAHSESSVILHTPDQICGFERSNQNYLLLEVSIKEHNSGALFSWYRDDEECACEIDLCFIIVTLPGLYKVNIDVGETAYLCEPVKVTG